MKAIISRVFGVSLVSAFVALMFFCVWAMVHPKASDYSTIKLATRNLFLILMGYGLVVHPLVLKILKLVFKGMAASAALKAVFNWFVIVNEREIEPVKAENEAHVETAKGKIVPNKNLATLKNRGSDDDYFLSKNPFISIYTGGIDPTGRYGMLHDDVFHDD